jgi:thymidylate synthase (FAD)
MLNVKLLDYSDDPINLIYTAARTCYSNELPENIWSNDLNTNKKLELITKVIGFGHLGILEHVYLNFSASGISRCLSHQACRHRLVSYEQKSQRYCNERFFDFVTPTSIGQSEFVDEYKKIMSDIGDFYARMTKACIPGEDARFILPNACCTSFVMSMNLREFLYVHGLRSCSKAQWEIRELFAQAKAQVLSKSHLEWLAPYLEPKCIAAGRCTEKDSCGYFKQGG